MVRSRFHAVHVLAMRLTACGRRPRVKISAGVDRATQMMDDGLAQLRSVVDEFRGRPMGPRSEAAYEEIAEFLRRRDRFTLRADVAANWRRNERKRRATPAWADLDAVDRLYQRCRMMNLGRGEIAYHVDHVIPLQGSRVCGLHITDNLRIVPKKMNCIKGNRYAA